MSILYQHGWLNQDLENSYKIVLDYLFKGEKLRTANRRFIEAVASCNENENFLLSTPWSISWQIVSNCNLRCKHCFFAGDQNLYNKNNDLNTQEVLKLTEELIKAYSVVAVSITGGEPLLRNDLIDVIKTLKKANVIVSLQTNGILITEKLAKKLSEVLNLNSDYVQISLDGTEESYNSIRGKNTFTKAIQGIKYLMKNGIKVNVNCTPIENNLVDLPDLYKLCTDLKINKFSIGRFNPYYKEQNALIPDFNSLIKAVADIIEQNKTSNTFFELNYKFFDFVATEQLRKFADGYFLNNKKNNTICPNLSCHNHNTVYINPSGKIYLCFAVEEENMELGDFRKESLKEIWKKRNNNEFFAPRLSNEMVCKTCKYFSVCKGGCMGYAYKHYGNRNYPDGLCLYAKEQFKI